MDQILYLSWTCLNQLNPLVFQLLELFQLAFVQEKSNYYLRKETQEIFTFVIITVGICWDFTGRTSWGFGRDWLTCSIVKGFISLTSLLGLFIGLPCNEEKALFFWLWSVNGEPISDPLFNLLWIPENFRDVTSRLRIP